jgi:hypothetical protein
VVFYGAVAMEIFGHLGCAIEDPTPMFEFTLADLATLVGLEYPPPAALRTTRFITAHETHALSGRVT